MNEEEIRIKGGEKKKKKGGRKKRKKNELSKFPS